jgi:hypothetical protein
MSAVSEYITRAADLYHVAPDFTLWALGALGALWLFTIGFSWFLRGYFVDGAAANTKGQIDNLKEQISLQDQRLKLAQDQNQDMKLKIDKLEEVRDSVDANLKRYLPAPEAASTTSLLIGSIESLRSANTAMSSTLTPQSGNLGLYRRIIELNKPKDSES